MIESASLIVFKMNYHQLTPVEEIEVKSIIDKNKNNYHAHHKTLFQMLSERFNT